MDGVNNSDLSPDRRHATQSIATISMAGTPKNGLNKIRKKMKRDKKEVAQDGVESAASLLRVGRLSDKVDEAAWPWYERVEGIISASIGMKTVVSFF